MKERYLTDDELRIISNHKDMLKGNINRMCVSDDIEELIKMYQVAILRIDKICDICMSRYTNVEEIIKNSEKNESKIIIHDRYNNAPIIISPYRISMIRTIRDDGQFTNMIGEYVNIVVDGDSFDIKESMRELVLKIKNVQRSDNNEEG